MKEKTLQDMVDALRLGVGYTVIELSSMKDNPSLWNDMTIARIYVNCHAAFMLADAIKKEWERLKNESRDE